MSRFMLIPKPEFIGQISILNMDVWEKENMGKDEALERTRKGYANYELYEKVTSSSNSWSEHTNCVSSGRIVERDHHNDK